MDPKDYMCADCATAWDEAMEAGKDGAEICDACDDAVKAEEERRRAIWREFTSYSDSGQVSGFCSRCLSLIVDKSADRVLCDRCLPVVHHFLGRRNAPCRPGDPACECRLCYQARPLLLDGYRERYRHLALAAEPARVTRWRDRPTRERPSSMSPAAQLDAIRAHVATLAGITPAAVTEADMVAAEQRLADARRAAEERKAALEAERRRAAEERWTAHLDAYPLRAAQERRDIFARRVEDEIARAVPYLAGVFPIEAASSEEDKRAIWAQLNSPNERGATRLKYSSDYKAAMEAAVAIAEGRERTVLLGGPTGGGKTTLAALMLLRIAIAWQRTAARGVIAGQRPTWCPSDAGDCADQAIRRSLEAPPAADGDAVFGRLCGSVRWTTATEIFALASTPRPFPRPGEQPVDPLAEIKAARILVIDEIAKEPQQRNVISARDIIFERACSDHLVTIVTTGIVDTGAPCDESDQEDVYRFLAPLVERYDQAIVRRVADPATATTLAIGFARPKGAPRGPKARTQAPQVSAPAPAPVVRSLSRRAPGSSRPAPRVDDLDTTADV